MLTKLRVEQFKNFKQAELLLGPLTLLVGANASGKSNLRDAFRFLHGIARGYTLADIIGEKYGEGGERQWTGIRGGINELVFQGASTFTLEISFQVKEGTEERDAIYSIEVDPSASRMGPRVVNERLIVGDFEVFCVSHSAKNNKSWNLDVMFDNRSPEPLLNDSSVPFLSNQPVLSQLMVRSVIPSDVFRSTQLSLSALRDMRFVDPSPDAMRQPSSPGQTILGDHGENLSSVLQAICEDEQRKQTLIQWIQELTPMDARDFDFPTDQIGRVLVTLVEANGQRTTAYSASDGTLRFLGMLAALLGPAPTRLYFFEELENGIHPTRLHLLLQLIEQQVSRGAVQVVATTHSPQLLRLVSSETLKHAALTYRLEGHTDAQIKRILDIPEAESIIQRHDLARLYESGWLENSVAFAEDEEVVT